jgi:hypothetical protein
LCDAIIDYTLAQPNLLISDILNFAVTIRILHQAIRSIYNGITERYLLALKEGSRDVGTEALHECISTIVFPFSKVSPLPY